MRFLLVQIQFLTNFRADSHFHQICTFLVFLTNDAIKFSLGYLNQTKHI